MTVTQQADILPLQGPGHSSVTLDNAGRIFWCFCILHLVVWTMVPALMYHNPPKDSLEGIAWGQMWLWGYDKHPFLAPWLTALFTEVFGVTGWPIYLLSQVSVVICFWAIRQLALPIVGPVRALLAVLILDGLYYYNVGAIPFNPNVAMLPTWALSVWAFREALLRPDLFRWLRVGVFAGLATLAKYESGILFIAMIGVLCWLPEGRRALRGRAFYWGVAAAVLVVAPNLHWIAKHDFAPLHYAFGNLNLEHGVAVEPAEIPAQASLESSIYPPLLFLLEQLGALLPVVLLYLPFLRWRKRDFRFEGFDRCFVLMMACGPLLVTEVFAILTNARLIARWGFPFFSLAGLALVMVFPPEFSAARWRRFFGGLLALLTLLIGGCYWTIFVRPLQTGVAPYSIAYPGQDVSDYVLGKWHERYSRPLKFIGGDRWAISTITAFSQDRPVPYFELSEAQSPWLKEDDLRRDGAVIIHQLRNTRGDEAVVPAIRKRFPGLVDETVMSFALRTKAQVPPVRMWVAILPPGSEAAGASGQGVAR